MQIDSQRRKREAQRGSIVHKTALVMGGLLATVILGVTLVTYGYIVRTTERQILGQLEQYVEERGQRERSIFKLAEDNHAILKAEVLERLGQTGDEDPVEEFDRLFVKYEDGVTRNRSEIFDGMKQAGVYIDETLEIDADIRRRVLTFFSLCNQFGPAWHNRFQDTYITTPENIMVIYWPEIPRWCQDATTDLYMPDEEYVWVADKSHNPDRETVWTGLFYDHVAKVWMVSCETPVDLDDRHIATLGHDITLNELVQRAVDDRLPGTYNVVFRNDGRLIAHPELLEAIKAKEGYFDIRESERDDLKAIFHHVTGRPTGRTVTELPEIDAYVAVASLDELDWQFAVVLPRKVVSATAFATARYVLLLGLIALIVETIALYLVMRHWIAAPLNDLADATERVAAGNLKVQLPADRRDEFGRLARSYNQMIASVAQRDAELAAHAAQLEERVAERTRELSESETRSRLLLESSGEGIFGVDTEGLVTFVNAAALKTLGFSHEQLLGKPVHDLIHHSNADGSPYPLEQCPMYRVLLWATRL